MKDSRLKYVEISNAFNSRATEVDLFCKQSQRICERVAKRLSSERPKTPLEFERQEYLKEFVLRVSKNNEATIDLLAYIKGFLQDVLNDASTLADGALLRDKLQFQSDTIELMQQMADRQVYQLKNEISRRNTANP